MTIKEAVDQAQTTLTTLKNNKKPLTDYDAFIQGHFKALGLEPIRIGKTSRYYLKGYRGLVIRIGKNKMFPLTSRPITQNPDTFHKIQIIKDDNRLSNEPIKAAPKKLDFTVKKGLEFDQL